MRILHLSTSDIGGGAARAAFRLHTGLQRLGHQSTMLVLRRTSGQQSVTQMKWSDNPIVRFRRSRRRRQIENDFSTYQGKLPPGFENFSDDRTEAGYDLVRQIPPCDLINLHWVAGFVDIEILFRHLPANVPLVWRLADMAPVTGGCHYDLGCGKFTKECGGCPVLGSTLENDLSRQVWKRKSSAFSRLDSNRLHIVGTSRWIAEQAKRSSLLGRFPSTVIPNGLDVEVFSPHNKMASRDSLGVPRTAKVVLFVADSANIKRKGFEYLATALAGISDQPDIFLLSVGGGKPNVPNLPQLHLGKIADDQKLAMIYSAADVFVIPSLQESFGQTVTESMACATPVVGFNVGGIPDMVRPDLTGQLAPVGDAPALRAAILYVLEDPAKRQNMSQNCRRIAVDEYSLDAQSRSYVRYYESILAASAAGR